MVIWMKKYIYIYIQQPEGFVVSGQEHEVNRLIKSVYGLNQASKQWHENFDKNLASNGFRVNELIDVFIANLMELLDS